MVLKLLQGPIVCTADPDDFDTAGDDVLMNADTCMWLDDHGLMGYCEIGGYGTRAGPGSTIAINLDGIFYVRHKTVGAVAPGGAGYDYITESGLVSFAGGAQYPFEPWTGSYITDQAIVDADWPNDNLLRLPDRFLTWAVSPAGNSQLASADLDEVTADLVVEYTFDPGFGITPGIHKRFMPGRDSLVYLWLDNVSGGTGTIVTYDWQKRIEVGTRRELGIDANTVVYSPRFNIFISLHTNSGNQEMRIWANEGEISALSAPIALDPITQGRVSTIQTTLTDDTGEGIGGRFIDWSITAGNGDLIPASAQSVTDEDGVAEIQYRAEITGGVDPTIQASVTF